MSCFTSVWRALAGPQVTDRKAQPRCAFCSIVAGAEGRLLYSDDRVAAFWDRSPAAAKHILVVSRAHIGSVLDLESSDCDIAAHMLSVGRSLVEHHAPGAEQKHGFHVPPFTSVAHLHLHAFALPFANPWRSLKYADGACWWISGDVLLRRLGPTVTGYGSLAVDAQSRSKT